MRNRIAVLVLATMLGAAGYASSPTLSSVRQHLRMDAGWRFYRGALSNSVGGRAISLWRWKAASDTAENEAVPGADLSGEGWQEAAPGQDTFHGRQGFSWYETTLPSDTKPQHTLHFESVDDNAVVYLNGTRLASHQGWDDPFDVPLDRAWHADQPNLVTVLVQNTDAGGGIGAARLISGATAAIPGPAQIGFKDTSWRVVHLPHDFVVEGQFTPAADAGHGSLPKGVAWYRKTFTLPISDKGNKLFLDFDGVYRDSKVWLNGHFLGVHPSGYTSFEYEITRYLNYGKPNTVAVFVDSTHSEGWWYEGGGIYRHVWLTVTAPLHIAHWGTFATASIPGEDKTHPSVANIALKTTLTNSSTQPTACQLVSQLISPQGEQVALISSGQVIAAGATRDIAQTISIRSPKLWSLETPQRYTLITQVKKNGQIVDQMTTPFGIRTIQFTNDQGFFLNGKHVEIQGTCNHQDFAGVGIAMPDSVLYWRIKKLKEMGSNAYRMSHNPPTPELLDACDRLGMLVMDENRHLGDTQSAKTSPGTPYSDLSELASTVLRDRNHPSIIMWSMCNEEPLQGTSEGARIFTAMKKVTDQLDGTRPVTCAMNDGEYHGIALVEDLRGFNYGPGVYGPYHDAHPDARIYGSEIGSTVSTRGIYTTDPEKGYVSAYDVNAPPWAQTAQDTWHPIAEQPFVAGGYVWTGFDYKGEPTPYGWPCINSHFGLLDECGFWKDDAYYYETQWKDQPLIHLLPHWNWSGQEGKDIQVEAYSNCARVEVFLNGQSQGTKEMPPHGQLDWSIPYAPGTLLAKGYDAAGNVVCTDTVTTTGTPTALKFSPDRTKLIADGEDVTMVAVSLVDSEGRIVPIADNQITFHVTGAGHVAGVGNGDPSSHEPDKATQRHAFNGLCLVLIGANEKPGTITLTATSPGLKSATLSLTSAPAVSETAH